MSKIEWTEQTWNPIVGCSIVTPGCTNCYAMKMAARLEAMGVPHYAGLTKPSKAGAVWTGKLALAPGKILTEPLRRKKPTMYFVNSMGDLFHEETPTEWIDRVFAVMALTPQHTYQVLTKRSSLMRRYFQIDHDHDYMNRVDGQVWSLLGTHEGSKIFHGGSWRPRWPLANVWLGVSAERQKEADERIPDLLATPAAVRFVSAEPLLGPIDFTTEYLRDKCGGKYPFPMLSMEDRTTRLDLLDWIIVGGESGPGARPMHPDWARSIRDQCAAADVAFFFKQWGEWGPERPHPVGDEEGSIRAMTTVSSTDRREIGRLSYLAGSGLDKPSTPLRRLGKARAGRLLDGREHNDMPNTKLAEVA